VRYINEEGDMGKNLERENEKEREREGERRCIWERGRVEKTRERQKRSE
jgi:hypothetical protein